MPQLVQKNEADATLRRLNFYLVDASDGITAETGEAAGQPQISVDGAAWTATGIGTLQSVGNGHYYAEVTQATTNVLSGIILGRYKSAATAESPALNSLQVVEWDPQTSPKTASDRLGGFTGTGINNVLGFLQAVMRSDASIPTDLGGTYAASGSQQAIRAWVDGMAGAGFAAGSDLVSIKNAISAIPGSGSGGVAGGGTSTTVGTFDPTGFMGTILGIARKTTDEPAVNAKYTDADILALTSDTWVQLWTDLNLTVEAPIIVRLDINVVSGTTHYSLPSVVGEIIRIAKVVADTGLLEFEMWPQSMYNPAGDGFHIEANTVVFTPTWKDSHTLRIEYIPSGEVTFHEGLGTLDSTTTFQMDSMWTGGSPSSSFAGTFDNRDNAYAGYLLRIKSGGSSWAERVISAYDEGTGIATISVPETGLSSAPGDNSYVYEVVPAFGKLVTHVLGLMVGRTILMREGNSKRYNLLTQEYKEKVRALRIKLRSMESRRADRFEGDVIENGTYRSVWPYGAGR